MPEIRIVVVDDHALFRAGLVSLLSEYPEFRVVGEAGDGRAALNVVRARRPDLVLMDVNMPVMDGVQAAAIMRETYPNLRILMLTVSRHDDDLFGAIAAGADGYLLKNAEPEDLHRSIVQVCEGKGVLDPDVTGRVLQMIAGSEPPGSSAGLSQREVDVLRLLAAGKTTSLIAQTLFISENTVKTHVRRIFEKLNVHNRAEAVSKALSLGILRSR